MTLRELQAAQKEWAATNFGPQPPWESILGVMEELGELCHAYLKRHQGIRGSQEELSAKVVDAVGDIVIFLAGACNALGIDLQDAVDRAWAEVSQRKWKQP